MDITEQKVKFLKQVYLKNGLSAVEIEKLNIKDLETLMEFRKEGLVHHVVRDEIPFIISTLKAYTLIAYGKEEYEKCYETKKS